MKAFLIAAICMYVTFGHSQNIKTQKVFSQDSVYISLENPFLAPVEFKISLRDSVNTPFKFKKRVVFKPKEQVKNVFVLPLSMVKDTASINVNEFVEIDGSLGNSQTAKHNESYRYTLPFDRGRSTKIIQSFGGRFSYNKKHSRYAVDFGLKIGDTVRAARDGIVIIVKEDSKEHGKTVDYADKGNKIIIMHNDGTFANYVHLDFEGALVRVGDKIQVGQAIGISGLTGFTTIPHLHFVVLEPHSKSVPIYFKDVGKKKLKPGKRYKRKR